MTRRDLGKLLLAVPAAGLATRALHAEPPPEEAEFIASHEPGLSDEERKRLLKGLPDQEKTLQALRDFPVPNDVGPCFVFRPLRSRKP